MKTAQRASPEWSWWGFWGFTVTELLVAIVLGAVLMSLLLGGLQQAKAYADKASCVRMMKTFHVAIIGYSNDHSGLLLPFVEEMTFANGRVENITWERILPLKGYLPSVYPGSAQLNFKMRCPANPNGYMPGPNNGKPLDVLFKDGLPNYVYNWDAGSATLLNSQGVLARKPRRFTEIVSPSKKAALYEGGLYKLLGTPFRSNYAVDGASTVFFTPSNNLYLIGDVHQNRSHVLFWDGHIETFGAGQIDVKTADWFQ